MQPDHPKTSADELLARLQSGERRHDRGKLKIFFGAAPGVGKTYAMLSAAREKVKEGVDLVIGWVQPHIRPETQALVLGLEGKLDEAEQIQRQDLPPQMADNNLAYLKAAAGTALAAAAAT